MHSLRATVDDRPALVNGQMFYQDQKCSLLVQDVRVGSTSATNLYLSVTAEFENAEAVAAYRFEDGAMRRPADTLTLPELDGAPEVVMRYDGVSVCLCSAEPLPLESFEIHLKAFQDLLTFASGLSCARLSLLALDEEGDEVEILGRVQIHPKAGQVPDVRNFVVRLGSTNTQNMLDVWWKMRRDLRPVTQVYVGAIYQPGYVESDFIAAATAVERMGANLGTPGRAPLSEAQLHPIRAALEGLTDLDADQQKVVDLVIKNRTRGPSFRERTAALAAKLPSAIITLAGINLDIWIGQIIAARNDVAHEGASDDEANDFVNGAELRAMRDASRIMIALLLAQRLGVTDKALQLAARQLQARYLQYHRSSLVFSPT
jgi:hypothetical protein